MKSARKIVSNTSLCSACRRCRKKATIWPVSTSISPARRTSTRGKYGNIKGKTKGDTSALLHPAMKRPWSKQEFAELAALLAAREKPLALVVEASKRPRRYDPLFTEKEGILSVILLPALLQYHDAAEALLARAMLRISEGKPAAAWDDLLTCHRLARLVGQGPTLADILYAVDLDGLACAGDQVLLQSVKLSAAEVAKVARGSPGAASLAQARRLHQCYRAIRLPRRHRPGRPGRDFGGG